MKMENKQVYTFWELIKDYKIVIPKIQRDYAQGRKDEKTEQVAKIFLSDLDDKNSTGEKINLDFVYGKIQEEQDKIKILTPLDGQQRLTTLFLIHWYLALKEGKLTEEIKESFSKFTYETRISSKDFCKYLIEQGIDFPIKKDKISEDIKDSRWYFLSWENDPTVSAMLNMLDKIHEKFKNSDNLFDKLINEKIITFNFLSLGDFKLSDDLYVKMNARGKPLTDFENFKANFSKNITDENEKAKLDNKWLDIFWKLGLKRLEELTEKEDFSISKYTDELFFNFSQNVTLNFYVETVDIDKKFSDKYSLFNIYEEVYKNQDYVKYITKILDCLTVFEDTNNIFSNFLQSHKDINYWQRVRFYALSLFFIKVGNPSLHQETFEKWLRVTNNLINNALIDSPDDYQKAIRSLFKLSNHITYIYDFLSDTSNNISYFTKLQREEESIKAKLILENSTWEDILITVENHSYFNGQIGFILEYAKDENENYDQDKFINYGNILSELFGDNFKENHDFLFQRALLAKGDFLVEIKSNWTFCSFEKGLRAKNDNWRKVFNNVDRDITKFLKSLLDDVSLLSLQKDLENIIEDYNIDDWRKPLVKNSACFKYCWKKQIRWEDNSNDKIYLLSKIQMNGKHAELYTYDLFKHSFQKKDFSPVFDKKYYFETNSKEKPYFYLSSSKFGNNWIKITYDQKDKYFITYDESENTPAPFPKETLEKLGIKYESEEKINPEKISYFENELEPKIRELAEELAKI